MNIKYIASAGYDFWSVVSVAIPIESYEIYGNEVGKIIMSGEESGNTVDLRPDLRATPVTSAP